MLAEMRFEDARRDYEDWKTRYRSAVGSEPPELWTGPARPAGAAAFVHDLSQGKPYAGKNRRP